jgi:hypothetical protein
VVVEGRIRVALLFAWLLVDEPWAIEQPKERVTVFQEEACVAIKMAHLPLNRIRQEEAVVVEGRIRDAYLSAR